jgi:hypothetical protein
MPGAPVTYHWDLGSSIVINPHTDTLYYSDIILPEKHTLRRILLAEPLCFWRRGSASSDDQQSYFVSYDVTYGYTEDAPTLYRSIRRMNHVMTVDATASLDVYFSLHSGAYNELGFNERVQRGGYYSVGQRVRMAWSISSSGGASEQLAGEANMSMRALYSLPVAP